MAETTLEQRSDRPIDEQRGARRWSSPELAIALAIGLLALGIYLWQLSVPEFLSFYDSGVYIAAAIHLVSGVMPYRDFTFVQPPGLVLLLSPVGVFSRIFGSHDGLVLGRVVTSFVTALNCALLAWLLRRRGRVTMVVAGAGLALIPVAFFESSAVKLEPYCLCFVLLAALVVLSDVHRQHHLTGRLLVGGVLMGFAAAIKLWAFFPFLALFACLLPFYRRRSLAFASGSAIGFLVPVLPFFLSAPGNFVTMVITEQLHRKANYSNDGGALWRLVAMTGFSSTNLAPTWKEALIAFVVLAIIVLFAFSRDTLQEPVDLFMLLGAVATAYMLFAAPDAYTYYYYFAAPFLLGLVAVSLARLRGPVARLIARLSLSLQVRHFVSWTMLASGVIFLAAATLYVTSFYTTYSWYAGFYGPWFKSIDQIIPKGACVVYDQISYGVYANRLTSSKSDCPKQIDPVGEWMAWGYQLIPPAPAFTQEWKHYFEEAQFVVLPTPHSPNVPWSPSLQTWFTHHYHARYAEHHLYIYEKDS